MKIQQEICNKYDAAWCPSSDNKKIGIAKNVFAGVLPINGLRHPETEDTAGWYIWAGGDIPNDSNFFEPIHILHLKERLPLVLKYLGLPPGYRFQIDDTGYEDIWFDEALLTTV